MMPPHHILCVEETSLVNWRYDSTERFPQTSWFQFNQSDDKSSSLKLHDGMVLVGNEFPTPCTPCDTQLQKFRLERQGSHSALFVTVLAEQSGDEKWLWRRIFSPVQISISISRIILLLEDIVKKLEGIYDKMVSILVLEWIDNDCWKLFTEI